jgi:hypothetical protein
MEYAYAVDLNRNLVLYLACLGPHLPALPLYAFLQFIFCFFLPTSFLAVCIYAQWI